MNPNSHELIDSSSHKLISDNNFPVSPFNNPFLIRNSKYSKLHVSPQMINLRSEAYDDFKSKENEINQSEEIKKQIL